MSKNKNPESAAYDALKGERVVLLLRGSEDFVTGTLVWVDRYTIGVREAAAAVEPTIFYKSALACLGLLSDASPTS